MFDAILIGLFVLGGIASIAFGVYEFIMGSVTNGLLAFILPVKLDEGSHLEGRCDIRKEGSLQK